MGKFDHMMAYDRSEINRLKKDIHYDDKNKKHHEGVVNYGKAGDDPIRNLNKGYSADKVGKPVTGGGVLQSRSPIMNRMSGFEKDGQIMNLTSKAHKDKLVKNASNPGFAAAIAKEPIMLKTNQDGGDTGKDYGAASKQIQKLGK